MLTNFVVAVGVKGTPGSARCTPAGNVTAWAAINSAW